MKVKTLATKRNDTFFVIHHRQFSLFLQKVARLPAIPKKLQILPKVREFHYMLQYLWSLFLLRHYRQVKLFEFLPYYNFLNYNTLNITLYTLNHVSYSFLTLFFSSLMYNDYFNSKPCLKLMICPKTMLFCSQSERCRTIIFKRKCNWKCHFFLLSLIKPKWLNSFPQKNFFVKEQNE